MSQKPSCSVVCGPAAYIGRYQHRIWTFLKSLPQAAYTGTYIIFLDTALEVLRPRLAGTGPDLMILKRSTVTSYSCHLQHNIWNAMVLPQKAILRLLSAGAATNYGMFHHVSGVAWRIGGQRKRYATHLNMYACVIPNESKLCLRVTQVHLLPLLCRPLARVYP